RRLVLLQLLLLFLPRRLGRRARRARSPRQLDLELGAAARTAVDADRAAVGGRDLARHVEAEADAGVAGRLDAALERREQPGEQVLVDADAVVAHGQHDGVGARFDPDRDRPPGA